MTQKRLKSWIEKVGVIGFFIFLAKGLAWLAAAGVVALFLS